MANRAALIARVLKNCGVWQPGQDLPPEDYRAVDEDLDAALATMAQFDVYIVDDADNIPDEALLPVADYLANDFSIVFGIAGDELAEIKQRANLADGILRYMRRTPPTFAPMKSDFF